MAGVVVATSTNSVYVSQVNLMAADFQLKKGDRLPSLVATLYDASGVADLSSATVTFKMELASAVPGGTVISGSCTVLGSGQVRYDWGASDSATVGVYDAEFVVTISGKDQTYPNGGYFTVEIVQDVS